MAKIVILGAGFGGLRAALDLAKAGREIEGHEVVLVDRMFHHVYTPLLYEVATGYFNDEKSEKKFELWERILCKGVCIRIEQLPAIVSGQHMRFEAGDITRIDRVSRQVVFADERTLSYDYLVLALGAETDYFGIPGIREHAIPFKTARDALTLRRRIMTIAANRRENGQKKVCIAVGGGGPTGVELAAEVTNMLRKMFSPRVFHQAQCSVMLVEASPRILGAFTPEVSAMAERRLRKLGVSLLTNVAVSAVKDGEITLTNRETNETKTIPTDIFVWTGGVRGNHLVNEAGFETDKKGRALVDEYLRIKDDERVFALGDAASCPNPKFKTEPGLGYVAAKQGSVVAANILRLLGGKLPEPYEPIGRVDAIIPLGGKHELAVIFGAHFHGFFAWCIRRFVDLRYFMSILPFRSALFFWLRGAKVYIQND